MSVRTGVLVALLVVLGGGFAAAGEGILTVDRFVGMVRCTDPQISPDGSLVAFTVSTPDVGANRSGTDIWIAPVAGGEPVRLTNSPGADYHPRWSPDGTLVAFVSTRSGSAQVWIIPAAGGEARQLTNVSTGANDPVWSPEGKRIAFYSAVYPDCAGDSCNAARAEAAESNPVKARVYTELLYRHWNEWRGGTRNHLFVADARTGVFEDLTAGRDHDYPTFPFGGSAEYSFSPDGAEICVSAKEAAIEAISTNTDLFVIDIAGRGMRKITTNEAADETPSYSPDGRWLAWRAQQVPGFESDRWRLMLLDRKTGEARSVTEDFDRWVSDYCWAADSRTIYLTAVDDGHKGIFALDVKTRKLRKIFARGNCAGPQVTPDGRTIVLARMSFDFPHSIWRISTDGKDVRRIGDFNRDVCADISLNTAEDVRYEGAEGAAIQAFLIKPPGFDPARRYPAIMLIHGGPQVAFIDSWYTNWNAQTFAAAGYVIFIPNFHGSDGYGQEFVNAINQDWGGRCYEDIMKGFEYLAALPFVDPKRIGAAGASYGGYMVNWIEGNTDRFACLLSMAGNFNLVSAYGATEELWFPEWEFGGTPFDNPMGYERWSPHNYAKGFRTPCMVVHGELDFRVPAAEGLQMFTALQRQGVPSKLVYFPDEGHWILKPANNRFYYGQFIGWMDEWLKR